ncbi:MAG TPA: hypothetical protein VE172_18375 [Stackebrandtia sp.]|jgi:hypothetical protein|uniref:hypothetical protein n=1 Tax=Stackebrandtia sp. TaxID=2023065 RepID=UPI002D733700|nr:hypothetical protein [Stackebrandtia sp.]HZE40772.1 hypothetical protein [Stackebrandtia sp.]
MTYEQRNPQTGLLIGLVVGGVVLLSLIGLGVILIASSGDNGSVAAVAGSGGGGYREPRTEGSGTSPSINPDAAMTGDGMFLIGEDIDPGEYATRVPKSSGLCYWERLKGTNGDFDDIIANGTASPGEKVRVTVEKSDRAFSTTGCGSWDKT